MTDQQLTDPLHPDWSPGDALAAALGDGIGAAVATLPPALVAASPSYPVQVDIAPNAHAGRFWAIPVLGFLVKAIILIPHYIALLVLSLVVGLVQSVVWVPVLVAGRYPGWAYSLTAGTIRWGVRVQAYTLGLTDQYPPFGPGGDGADPYPVRVVFTPQQSYNRAWAIPLVGLMIKAVLAIPHTMILLAFGAVIALLQWVLWVPVLFTGTYPAWGYQLVGGHLRWSTRVSAYLYGLTDQYPPFEMG